MQTRTGGYAGSYIAMLFMLVLGIFYILRSEALFLADGYIFLAYARQITGTLTWGINANEVSFATSSPLWALLCAFVQAFVRDREEFQLTMQVVGLLFMLASVPLLESTLQRLRIAVVWRAIAILIFVAVPFNGLFYAISAMETGLYLFLFLLIVRIALFGSSAAHAAFVGFLCGLLYLTRVEGAICLLAFLIIVLRNDLSRRAKLNCVIAASAAFVITIAPWQFFLFRESGLLVPSSASGRLFLYFPLKSIGLSDYLQLNPFQRLGYLREIIWVNFFEHPVMLIFGFVPVVGTIAAAVVARLWNRQLNSDSHNALIYFAAYNALNFGIYAIFQPLIFQRYLIAAYPSFALCTAVLGNSIRLSNFWMRRPQGIAVLIFSATVVLFANLAGLYYFDFPTKRDTKAIELLKRFAQTAPQDSCRLAAEPLGMAAYFTDCYVVDLGGLINPDIWPYWLAAGHDHMFSATIQYAIRQRANFLFNSDPLPPEVSGRFSVRLKNDVSAIYQWNSPPTPL